MSTGTATTTVEGFTGSEATKRLKDKVGKVQVSFLALSIMAKMKGKSNRSIVNDLGDACPSWISKIFTIADKAMAHIPLAVQNDVSRMTVAKAEEAVTSRIEAHMTALGVTSFEKYGKVCHFAEKCEASQLVLNPPKEEPTVTTEEAKPEATAEGEPEGETIEVTPADWAAMFLTVDDVDAAIAALMDRRNVLLAEAQARADEAEALAAAA